MKNILILGAGRSSSALISYLLRQAASHPWNITVGDFSVEAARERIGSYPAQAIHFDIQNKEASREAIDQVDIVVSLIPAHLHPLVAQICVEKNKHLLTASYVSDEMKKLDGEASAKQILFLNECGLDPGIDHMSAMQVIDKIKRAGGTITSFESFTGGLIAPETDPQNPWRYKFTWNPRNVVMAGQSTAKFLQDGSYKYIPYQQLFQRTTAISVPGQGEFEGYANRDSLKYTSAYGLEQCKTMLRGTLRNRGYCSAWNVLVQLGCCDDSFQMENVETMTHQQFIASFIDSLPIQAERKVMQLFNLSNTSEEMKRLTWSGLFSEEKVGLKSGTPAQILEHILNKKWKLNETDKDYIVMWHRFKYESEGKQKEIQAYLAATGENATLTAMAKTVGLPLGIATKLLAEGKLTSRGVQIPVASEFYEPILSELKSLGIGLEEKETA
jgi:saccharopine dehydrogenase (NADP+, L-glutamate forming)